MSDNKDQEYFDSKIHKIKKAIKSLPKIVRVFLGLTIYILFAAFIFEDTLFSALND